MGPVKLYLLFAVEMLILGLFALYTAMRRALIWMLPGQPKSLKNEVILITGGANGIGREICRELCKHETDLTLISWDTDEAGNDDLMRELRGLGVQKAYMFTVDVSDRGQVEAATIRVREEVGSVTILINNAGIGGDIGEAWKTDPEHVERVLKVNFLAQCWTLREFVPSMIAQNKGHIVTVCSILGFSAGPAGGAYIASKHALKGYMESFKEDLRASNINTIKVTMAFPHNTLTNLSAKAKLRAGKYPFLFPQLKPQEVASKIVSGMLAEEEYVYVPGYVRLLHMTLSLLPPEVIRRSIDIADIQSESVAKPKAA